MPTHRILYYSMFVRALAALSIVIIAICGCRGVDDVAIRSDECRGFRSLELSQIEEWNSDERLREIVNSVRLLDKRIGEGDFEECSKLTHLLSIQLECLVRVKTRTDYFEWFYTHLPSIVSSSDNIINKRVVDLAIGVRFMWTAIDQIWGGCAFGADEKEFKREQAEVSLMIRSSEASVARRLLIDFVKKYRDFNFTPMDCLMFSYFFRGALEQNVNIDNELPVDAFPELSKCSSQDVASLIQISRSIARNNASDAILQISKAREPDPHDFARALFIIKPEALYELRRQLNKNVKLLTTLWIYLDEADFLHHSLSLVKTLPTHQDAEWFMGARQWVIEDLAK